MRAQSYKAYNACVLSDALFTAALYPVVSPKKYSQEPTMSRVQTLHNAYDFIVTFLEGLVESTLEVQKENRQLLR